MVKRSPYYTNGAVAAYVPRHPSAAIDLSKLLKLKKHYNDLDRLQPWYSRLIAKDEFRALVDGVNSESSVEGRPEWDDAMAAAMIREDAEAAGDEIGSWQIGRIVRALRGCMRRHGLGRKARLLAAIEALRLETTKAGSTDTEQ